MNQPQPQKSTPADKRKNEQAPTRPEAIPTNPATGRQPARIRNQGQPTGNQPSRQPAANQGTEPGPGSAPCFAYQPVLVLLLPLIPNATPPGINFAAVKNWTTPAVLDDARTKPGSSPPGDLAGIRKPTRPEASQQPRTTKGSTAMNLNDPQKLNDPQNNWWQLCGALGVLQSAGVDLPWPEINAELLTLARQHGPAAGETSEARQMLATYRRLCLDRGLIRRGQLFTLSDSIHGPGR